MVDVFTKAKRSWIMSRIKGRHTKPEEQLCAVLTRLKMAPIRNDSSLAGSPDFVLRRKKIAVFLHGCFWHGHPGCLRASLPATRRVFWKWKIAGNRRRDLRQMRRLRREGWSVAVFWTCGRITPEGVEARVKRILAIRKRS